MKYISLTSILNSKTTGAFLAMSVHGRGIGISLVDQRNNYRQRTSAGGHTCVVLPPTNSHRTQRPTIECSWTSTKTLLNLAGQLMILGAATNFKNHCLLCYIANNKPNRYKIWTLVYMFYYVSFILEKKINCIIFPVLKNREGVGANNKTPDASTSSYSESFTFKHQFYVTERVLCLLVLCMFVKCCETQLIQLSYLCNMKLYKT